MKFRWNFLKRILPNNIIGFGYEGNWVAYGKPGEYKKPISYGEDLQKVYEEARAKGCEDPFITYIPDSPSYYAAA